MICITENNDKLDMMDTQTQTVYVEYLEWHETYELSKAVCGHQSNRLVVVAHSAEYWDDQQDDVGHQVHGQQVYHTYRLIRNNSTAKQCSQSAGYSSTF